ncbi:MAG: hypothetical protein GY754_35235 [bacterium]|nr:hypothetical protein [bacterium]
MELGFIKKYRLTIPVNSIWKNHDGWIYGGDLSNTNPCGSIPNTQHKPPQKILITGTTGNNRNLLPEAGYNDLRITPPVPIKKFKQLYPPLARKHAVEAAVYIHGMNVSKNGKITKIRSIDID